MLPHYSATQYPHCTESSAHHSDTDCGSTAWAFSLFIAWNILSMVSLGMRHFVLGRQNWSSELYQYIFVNMFTGASSTQEMTCDILTFSSIRCGGRKLLLRLPAHWLSHSHSRRDAVLQESVDWVWSNAERISPSIEICAFLCGTFSVLAMLYYWLLTLHLAPFWCIWGSNLLTRGRRKENIGEESWDPHRL